MENKDKGQRIIEGMKDMALGMLGAPAAGTDTIDSHVFRDLLWAFERNSGDSSRISALIAHINAALAARAEEARREGAEAERARLVQTITNANNVAAEALRQRDEAIAQRTAGGDAVSREFIIETAKEHGVFGRVGIADLLKFAAALVAQPVEEAAAQADGHLDDYAVNAFAAAMRAKMAASRAKGRGGWDDDTQCSEDQLQRMLLEHVAKGDPVDVGNFAMMLRNRDGRTSAAPTAQPTPQAAAQNEANSPQTRMVASSDVLLAAQPTPPDDEIVSCMLEAAAVLAGEQEGRAPLADELHGAALMLRDRAALRHPPAPNVGELTERGAVQNIENGLQTRMDTGFEPLPDWIKLDGDTTIIHGVRYSNALLEDFGGALPTGQPFLIESRETDSALCVVKLDWAVVAKSGAAPNPADEDAARYRFLRERTVAWNALARPVWRSGAALDKAIDAARAAAAKEKT